jgi:hypothetical protein
MPLAFRTKRITINRGSGTIIENDDLDFDSEVLKADVTIKGFQLDFEPAGREFPLNVVEVTVAVDRPPQGNTVNFQVTARYTDKNATAVYKGFVDVLGIAEVR